MKTAVGIFGILLILSGVVWFFQGIGVLPGSFMTGQTFWAVAGFLTVVAGVALVRRRRHLRRFDPPPVPGHQIGECATNIGTDDPAGHHLSPPEASPTRSAIPGQ